MHYRAFPVILGLTLLCQPLLGPSRARADVEASGTRISIAGGPARFYMTYGNVEESELYAPILGPVQRLGLALQRQGDDYEVYVRGVHVETWPVVTSRQEVPDTGEHPCVLVMGGGVYLPVRALGRLLTAQIGWNRGTNLVDIALRPDGSARRLTRSDDDRPAVLSNVEVSETAGEVRIRIRSSRQTTPTWIGLQHLSPPRIALDFPGARWADGIHLPGGGGGITGIRTGYPSPGIARLALDLKSSDLHLTALNAQSAHVEACFGPGPEIAKAPVGEEAERILKTLRRRVVIQPLIASRGSLPEGVPAGVSGTTPIDLDPLPTRPGPFHTHPAASLTGKSICLDAGHGGSDTGALGKSSHESDLCLMMILDLKSALEELGARIVLTRSADTSLTRIERMGIVNGSGADCMISIHCNSMPRPNTASGSETYYVTPQSARLAAALHPRVVGAVKGRDGGIRNHRKFFMIHNTQIPSVLLEVGFINHFADEALLCDPAFRGSLSASIAQGVLDYFGSDTE